jgi:hypothetical protein
MTRFNDKKITQFFIMVVVVFWLGSNVIAEDFWYLGPELYSRNYKEELTAPFQSDEHGMLYGLVGGYTMSEPDDVYADLNLAYAMGKTKYDGALQNLATGAFAGFHQSKTKNKIFNAEAVGGYNFDFSQTLITLYLGLGYHEWSRDLGKNTTTGYVESYAWPYVALGIKTATALNDIFDIGVDVKTMVLFRSKMKLDGLSQKFKLGNKPQVEISLPITYKFSQIAESPLGAMAIKFIPYFRQEKFGESDVVTVNTALGPIGLREPASKASVYGLKIAMIF